MSKILLINPNKWGRGITSIWIPSHTAALKAAGHEVKLFDATFYSSWTENELKYNTLNKQYKPTKYDEMITWKEGDVYEDLQEFVNDFQPNIIFWSGVSSHIHGEGEYVNIQYGHDLIQNLKTDAFMITGGLQATAIPYLILKKFPSIDYIIRGESELLLPEILTNIDQSKDFESVKGLAWLKEGQLVANPKQEIIKDMDRIPPYDYSIFENQVFYRPYNGDIVKGIDYEMSRGCIFTCSYCVETVLQDYYDCKDASDKSGSLLKPQNYLRSKSAKRVFDELKYLNREVGIKLIRCQDTNFLTINRKMLLELATLLDESDLDIKLYIETRIDRINKGEIKLLKRLKVDGVGTGLEVASEQFREGHLNRFATPQKIIDNSKLLREAGIRVTTYNIIGLPDETEDMILDTIKFNQELMPDNITVAFYSPYKGTIEAEKGEKIDDFHQYEENVDGQMRTVSHSKLIEPSVLEFYKKHFSHFVFEGLEDLDNLKKQEGLL